MCVQVCPSLTSFQVGNRHSLTSPVLSFRDAVALRFRLLSARTWPELRQEPRFSPENLPKFRDLLDFFVKWEIGLETFWRIDWHLFCKWLLGDMIRMDIDMKIHVYRYVYIQLHCWKFTASFVPFVGVAPNASMWSAQNWGSLCYRIGRRCSS